MNDDAELIAATLAGHSDAFGRLVTKYQDRLYNTLVHVVGSTEEAEDVAQDAFVQAFLKLKSFKGHSAFFTWLYRIAFNVAISQRRKHKSTLSIDQQREASGQEPHDPIAAPTERIERVERVEQVRSALAALGEEHRTVLILREIDNCSYDVIAEILDLPVGTVRSRLHRARLELRDQLRESLQQDAN